MTEDANTYFTYISITIIIYIGVVAINTYAIVGEFQFIKVFGTTVQYVMEPRKVCYALRMY